MRGFAQVFEERVCLISVGVGVGVRICRGIAAFLHTSGCVYLCINLCSFSSSFFKGLGLVRWME